VEVCYTGPTCRRARRPLANAAGGGPSLIVPEKHSLANSIRNTSHLRHIWIGSDRRLGVRTITQEIIFDAGVQAGRFSESVFPKDWTAVVCQSLDDSDCPASEPFFDEKCVALTTLPSYRFAALDTTLSGINLCQIDGSASVRSPFPGLAGSECASEVHVSPVHRIGTTKALRRLRISTSRCRWGSSLWPSLSTSESLFDKYVQIRDINPITI
jgi:hypothetical protein